MPHDLTHASFFSGVGGLDIGLERAGWRTVSFSEIDPYASAVLAERWPGVPNHGDITEWRSWRSAEQPRRAFGSATLWTGGFPCQDLSVAGKRAGMGTEDDRTRSGLAYAFLDLVEQHRPPAILLENVPGLLSSNGGRDLGALLGRLGNLRYWWAYRILDAQFFGVPQRRRRVFICALHAGAGFGPDSPAEVLSVGARCGGHSQAGDEARTGVALGLGDRTELAGSLTRRYGKGINTTLDDGATIVRPSPDSGGVREADGLAGRPHNREVVGTLTAPDTRHNIKDGKRQDGSRRDRIPVTLAPTLRVGPARPQDGGPGDTVPIIPFVKKSRYGEHGDPRRPEGDDAETWADGVIANTLNSFDVGDIRTTHAVVGGHPGESDLLPLGLDSHRYRCCGNGVVSNVSEWIGVRLAKAVTS